MAKVRYTGIAGVREISATDFKSVGVEDQGLIRLRGVNYTGTENHDREVDVSDAAAKYLTENEDFELVDQQTASASSSTADKTKSGK